MWVLSITLYFLSDAFYKCSKISKLSLEKIHQFFPSYQYNSVLSPLILEPLLGDFFIYKRGGTGNSIEFFDFVGFEIIFTLLAKLIVVGANSQKKPLETEL